MSKYLKLFETTAAYNAAKDNLIKPNVSLTRDNMDVHYLPVEPITIVYKGDNASATNIMTKTINAFGDTYTLDEASITKMTLDDNKVTLTDFNIANLGQYGGTCDVYTYTFNDANEHTLKVWTNSSDMFRLSPWFSGPSPSQSAYFSSIKSVVIPNTITSIDNKAFYRCTGLTSITIPDTVTSIGGGAFSGCSGLISCTIGSGITSIGDYAFWGCSGLTSIDIPSGVTSIGDNAFRYCSGLTSIDIPSGVTSIGDYAFQGCPGLTSITSNAVTAPSIQRSTFEGIKTGGTLTVPSGSSGYDVWMGTGDYYLGKYSWTKVEQ